MSYPRRRGGNVLRAIFICLALLVFAGGALAQGGIIPIVIGQNVTGNLTAEANTAQFALTVNGGETAVIQLLAISNGFMPRFRILNAAGVETLNVPNLAGQTTVIGNATFSNPGVYILVVDGVNGTTGQFVLSLQAGTPLPAPVTLTPDQPISATVGSQTPVQVYRFNTTSLNPLILTVLSQTPGTGPLVTLYDESAGKTIGTNDAGVIGVAYQLPAAERLYRVEVSAGTGDTAFTICVGTCPGGLLAGNTASTPPVEGAIPTAQPAAATCTASSSAGGSVNLRTGPGTNYAAIATLALGQSASVVGQWTGGGWYAINTGTQQLWVGASVVTLSGDCTALPLLQAPANAQQAPTQPPAQAPTQANPLPPVNTTPEVEPTADNTPRPNLTVTNIRLTLPGDGTLNVDVTVGNAGAAPVNTPYAVETCLDGETCEEITGFAAGLQPGESMSFTVSLPFSGGAGTHVVSVEADSQNQVTEFNEGDNAAFSSFNF